MFLRIKNSSTPKTPKTPGAPRAAKKTEVPLRKVYVYLPLQYSNMEYMDIVVEKDPIAIEQYIAKVHKCLNELSKTQSLKAAVSPCLVKHRLKSRECIVSLYVAAADVDESSTSYLDIRKKTHIENRNIEKCTLIGEQTFFFNKPGEIIADYLQIEKGDWFARHNIKNPAFNVLNLKQDTQDEKTHITQCRK
jgi:hypothetical protein